MIGRRTRHERVANDRTYAAGRHRRYLSCAHRDVGLQRLHRATSRQTVDLQPPGQHTLTWGSSTGSLNGDGSFKLTDSVGNPVSGVFATEGGRTVIRDGEVIYLVKGVSSVCRETFIATKQ
jgi:hypothetical protein